MPQTKFDWARGFALQALSDLRVREMLVSSNAEKCHRLHFLQMAAEKACKAHLIIKNGNDSIRKRHDYIAKFLPVIARHIYSISNDKNRMAQWEMDKIKILAHEIELVCPGCDDSNTREDNSEYPWLDTEGNVEIPCQYNFPKIDDGSREIIRLIKLIRTASEFYARNA
jgi:hypothetical protein